MFINQQSSAECLLILRICILYKKELIFQDMIGGNDNVRKD